MRNTFLLLFLLVSAAFAGNSYSQSARVTLVADDIPTGQVLDEIERQTQYLFIYDQEEIDTERTVNIDAKRETVANVLTQVFEGTDTSYAMEGNSIMLMHVDQAPNSRQQQTGITVTGTVRDGDGEPIIGANVSVKGQTQGTITDMDGNFRLPGVPKDATLQVSFIGFKTTEVKASSDKLAIVLEDDSQLLGEVEVVAYGAQKKITVTGAIASVKSDQLTQTVTSDVTQTLAGIMTGVSSVQSSGEPGADGATLYIRGQASFNDSSPLIQLDGVVMEDGTMTINDIDPDEIESITVLKDASATAVFGVRGANGAILITTKRGAEGKPQISVNFSETLLVPNRPVEMVNSYEYATAHNEFMENDGNEALFSEQLIQYFQDHSQPILFPDMDWIDYMMKDYSLQTKAGINISGGNKMVRYFVSGSYFKQGGVFEEFDQPYTYNFDYHRYNYRANIDINVTPTTLISADVAGSIDRSSRPYTSSSSNVFKELYFSTPFSSPGIVDGKYIRTKSDYTYGGATLPFTGNCGFDQYYNNGYYNIMTYNLSFQLSLEQDLKMITKGLSFTVKGAYNSQMYVTKYGERDVAIYYPKVLSAGYVTDDGTTLTEDTVVLTKEGQDGQVEYSSSSGKARNWYFDARLNYSRTFGDHTVGALLLYNQSRRYYPSEYPDIPTGYVGLVGRVTYNYKDRYLAEFNIGYNGSENFASDRRFGTFPAGSVGWIVSEEKWFQKLKPTIDFLKLRGSWGLVGSDAGVSRFYYTADTYTISTSARGRSSSASGYGYNFGVENSTVSYGAYESTKHNQLVGWEKSFKQNYGIDINFFDSKLKASFDYYKEHRTGILLTDYTAPTLIGFTVPTSNNGVVNSWGWELSLRWDQKVNKNFRYWVGGNLSYNQNKIIVKKEAPMNNAYSMEEGHRIGSIRAYQFFEFYDEGTSDRYRAKYGVDMPTQILENIQYGDCVYVDLDGSGEIDSDDRSRALTHTEDPEYTLGFAFGFQWKKFSLSTQWVGAFNVVRSLSGNFQVPFYTNNTTTQGGLLRYQYENTWSPDNPGQDYKYPRYSQVSYSQNYTTSTLYTVDAKYIRLKTLQLAYTFDGSWVKRVGLNNLQLQLSGYNLLTFTPFIWGDPEGVCTTAPSYPLQRTFTLSLKLDF